MVVGIFGQTSIVKKNGSLEKIGGSRHFRPNVNGQKNGSFENLGHTFKIMIIMITSIIIINIIKIT